MSYFLGKTMKRLVHSGLGSTSLKLARVRILLGCFHTRESSRLACNPAEDVCKAGGMWPFFKKCFSAPA